MIRWPLTDRQPDGHFMASSTKKSDDRLDAIVNLQKQRQLRASHDFCECQFHDRSAVCTAALAAYLSDERERARFLSTLS